MPIFKYNTKTIYFNHIPKCAGTSIENYFLARGGQIHFYDNWIYNLPERERWNKSSPQHIDGRSLSRLFQVSFFDHIFVISREPISRFRSAFMYEKYIEKTIPEEVCINIFVNQYLESAVKMHGGYDNHFRTQKSFLVAGWSYLWFKIENGLTDVKRYIDKEIFCEETDKVIPHRMKAASFTPISEDIVISESGLSALREIYEDDFSLFKY